MASLEELRTERLRKLALLKERGMAPYPISTRQDVTLAEAAAGFTKLSKKKKVTIAGRVMGQRGQGAIIFFDLYDGTGSFQCLLKKDAISPELFSLFADAVD